MIGRLGRLVSAALFSCSTIASAQVLELGGSDAPPSLQQPTRAALLAIELESEIAAMITREAEASSLERAVLRAGVNVRVLAADLLAAGDEMEGAGSPAALMGLTLANGRLAIDERLQSILEPGDGVDADPATLTQARRAIAQFNDDASPRLDALRDAGPARLDRAVPLALAPLADAVTALGGDAIVSHWPTRSEVITLDRGAGADRPASPTFTQEQLRDRLDRSTLPDATCRLLAEILDYLRRAEPFADLRAVARGYRDEVGEAFLLEEALADAGWLDDAPRAAIRDRLHQAVSLFRDPATRERGTRRLRRLARARHTMERITELSRDGNPARETLGPVVEAFVATHEVLAAIEDEAAADAAFARLGDVVDRMIRFRRREPFEAGGPLRVVHRQLERAARDAEDALLAELRTLGADADALADPAFTSLVAEHRQRLEDLRRVGRVPQWTDTVTLLHPPSGRRFAGTARRWAEQLIDPARRPEAIRLMGDFERELEAYYPLPFERELRAGGPAAIEATGGFETPFAAELDRRRQAWVEQWAAGRGDGPASRSMRLLHRLTTLMSDLTTVLQLGRDATVLDRWAAWELEPGALGRVLSELPSRVKLAVAAVLEDDDEALARQLAQLEIDAPLARLLGRLIARLEPSLATRPAGAASTLGQLIVPPSAASWLVDRRRTLADLCRYAVEESSARRRGDLDQARRLAEYVNATATDLLQATQPQ